ARRHLDAGVQVVLCGGAPGSEEIAREMAEAVEAAKRAAAAEVVWIPAVLPKADTVALYTHASVFVCPSVYEPFGIINLEAMACGTPVVASRVGGIPEIVVSGETGELVPIDAKGENDFEPKHPETFARHLAEAVNRLIDDPARLERMGRSARDRVERL